MPLLFGPAGIPISSESSDSITGIRTVKALGLDAMEMEFVRGVRMSEKTATEVRKVAEAENVALTAHGPYYINLNSHDAEKQAASVERVYQTARIGYLLGCKSVTFHAAYYMKDPKEQVYSRVKSAIVKVMARMKREGMSIRISPETTGKPTQFGTVEELIKLAQEIGTGVCVDWAHLHARSNGAYNTREEFAKVLDQIKEGLGPNALKQMHMHISGIAYSVKGEKHHLLLKDADLNWRALLKVLKEYGVGGIAINESPNLEEDALAMKKYYRII